VIFVPGSLKSPNHSRFSSLLNVSLLKNGRLDPHPDSSSASFPELIPATSAWVFPFPFLPRGRACESCAASDDGHPAHHPGRLVNRLPMMIAVVLPDLPIHVIHRKQGVMMGPAEPGTDPLMFHGQRFLRQPFQHILVDHVLITQEIGLLNSLAGKPLV
jgi:hypothetical protein